MQVSDLFNYATVTVGATKSYEHVRELINLHDFESISIISAQDSFILGHYSRNIESILNYEAARYGCAALETYLNISHEPISHKSLNWALIRSYYAAFFAAHACLRTAGYLVCHLDKNNVSIIQDDVNRHYPGSVKPFASTYRIKYDASSLQLNFNQTDSSGGYHETFWPVFLEYLNFGFSSPLSSQVTFQDEILLLSMIRDNLLGSGNYAWLSEIRNIVNYKLPLEIWYPYTAKKKAPFYEEILRDSNVRKNDLNDFKKLTSTQIYPKFVGTCDAIIALMMPVVNMFFAQSQIRNNKHAQTYNRLIDIYNETKYAA